MNICHSSSLLNIILSLGRWLFGRWVGGRLVGGSVSKCSVVSWSVVGGFNKLGKKIFVTRHKKVHWFHRRRCYIVTKYAVLLANLPRVVGDVICQLRTHQYYWAYWDEFSKDEVLFNANSLVVENTENMYHKTWFFEEVLKNMLISDSVWHFFH